LHSFCSRLNFGARSFRHETFSLNNFSISLIPMGFAGIRSPELPTVP
jgi:hypothetical protein